jgi:2'-5' RNA ligase
VAANARNVARALRPLNKGPGGARPTAAPQMGQPYAGGISPLAMESQAGGGSWANAYGNFLPRDPQVFTQGAFGPFTPILPVPVDSPPAEDAPRAEPRLWQYGVGWNLPVGEPGTEGVKLADFGTLKTLSELYSVARACIQLRKSEVRGLEWDVVPTKEASKAMRGDRGAMKDFGARRSEAVKFFRRPDPDYFTWNNWLDASLEQVFTFDALALLMMPKWGKGSRKGLLGSDLDSLQLISGPSIRPLLGMRGQTPRPPAPAYQQYLYGVPRSDLTTVISGRDIDDAGLTGAEVAQFRGDQLLYLPMVPRRETPYGMPPIERALIPVMAGLQKQAFQLDFFREGSVPAVYISPGGVNSNLTPNQIRELQDALNGLAGDPAYKHKIIVLPADSHVMPQKQTELADQFDEIVMNQVCCVPGTQIVTKRGLIAIEDVSVGDEVLTHKGRWRPVLAKFKNERGERGVRKLTANGFDALEVTDNHNVWGARYDQTLSYRSIFDGHRKVVAADLKPKHGRGYFDAMTVAVPCMGPEGAALTLADHELRRGRKAIPARIPMGAALGRLLGFYLAEGSQSSHGDVYWSFNHNEFEYQDQVRMDLKTVFGLESSTHVGTATSVVAHSVTLADLFKCGTARNKVIPQWAWDGSPEFYRAMWDAWIAGDGTRRTNGWRGYTSSKALAWQMRLVALALGYAPQLRTQKQPAKSVIDGRVINGMDHIWCVEVLDNKQRTGVYRVDDGCLTSPLRANESSEYVDSVVWNLNVQEDHSYLTTGGQVFNCMAFDIQPMELGIMPKVSTSVSPGAANQMAKSTGNMHERKATKPLLKYLADIFNYILQDVCGQEDMQFMFEGLEEDEDEETQTQLLSAQINVGLRSIDEGREALGLQPWGLPETSDPGWGTPTGFVPLGQLLATGEVAPGQQPNANAPATAQPGQNAKPGNAGQSPGHDAAEAGSKPGTSKPTAKPSGNGSDPAASSTGSNAPAKKTVDADTVKTASHQARRDDHVAAATSAVARRLREVVDAFANGSVTAPHAIDTAVAALAAGYRRVMADAANHARKDHPVAATKDDTTGDDGYTYVDPVVDAAATQRAESQRTFLMGLLMALAAGGTAALDKIASRLDLYTRSLNTAYNVMYGQTVQSDHPHYEVIWHLGAAEHCKLCIDRDGQVFTFDSLPGYPGDGPFGGIGAICLGSANCHCSLEYREPGAPSLFGENTQRPDSVGYYRQQLDDITAARDAAAQARTDFLGSIPDAPAMRAFTRDEIRRELADLANRDIRAAGGYPGVSVEPLDISASDVAALVPDYAKSRAAASELEALGRHLRKGRLISTWEPRHITQDTLARIAEHIAKGLPVDTAINVVKATRRVSIDGQEYWDAEDGPLGDAAGGGGRVPPGGIPGPSAGGEPPRWDPPTGYMDMWPQGGHGTTEPGTSGVQPGSSRGRAPNAMGKGASDLTDPNPVEAEHVVNQMRKNYPEKSLGWMNGARWIGPVQVPLDRIDFDDVDSWAASHQMDRVKQFVKQIREGSAHLHPAVAVQEPGDDKIKIIDGHHRTLAYKKLGLPVKAYVGFVDSDGGPWDETHSFQFHEGSDPKNKSARGYDINPRSGMISLDIPEGVIPVHPGGVTDHHITVVYLGSDLTDEQYTNAVERASAAASKINGPIVGMVTGVGTFPPSGGSDWKTPAFAHGVVPAAHPLRDELADLSASEHTDWKPHITLAYIDEGDPLPDPVPATPVTFTHLSVHLGDHVEMIPFGSADGPTAG